MDSREVSESESFHPRRKTRARLYYGHMLTGHLNQAEAIDRKLANGEEPGLLAGIPISVKDVFCVKGTRSTAASKILGNFTAPIHGNAGCADGSSRWDCHR
jgi:Asp-tRNA(Asn)/Glu-tRNA(Gln) amidotransferase A subunit family amidase